MDWRTSLVTVGIIVLCFVGIPIHVNVNKQSETAQLFETYIRKYNKSYKNHSSEYNLRLSNFQESLKKIEHLNGVKTSDHSAIYGLTKFSDLSPDEFLHNHLQPELSKHLSRRKLTATNHLHSFKHNKKHVHKREALPTKVDWREKNIIGPIRNQKTCGACWAFSTVETVESMQAMNTGKVEILSVQQVIDCARNGNMGCNGGDTCSVLDWMMTEKIYLMPEKGYPLKWITGTCPLQRPSVGVQVAEFTCDTFVGEEDFLLQMLAYHGPVAVAVNAINWQYYISGVIQFHCAGGPKSVNHAVQIVGYDQTAPVPHYIARNSWGTDFGDGGYLYIAIGGNICGIATEVSSVDVF